MFESETYLAMFKELYDGALETGPFDRDFDKDEDGDQEPEFEFLNNAPLTNDKQNWPMEILVIHFQMNSFRGNLTDEFLGIFHGLCFRSTGEGGIGLRRPDHAHLQPAGNWQKRP